MMPSVGTNSFAHSNQGSDLSFHAVCLDTETMRAYKSASLGDEVFRCLACLADYHLAPGQGFIRIVVSGAESLRRVKQ